jgi:hypothetical protein
MFALIRAHARSGAPGDVVGFFADGRYRVRLQDGTFKVYPMLTYSDRVTVKTSWSIAGQPQRRQATAMIEE